MKYVNGFTLFDSGGNEVRHMMMLEHLKAWFDSDLKEKGYPYVVKDEVSGYKLEVTENTSVEDWRSFSYKCDLALD